MGEALASAKLLKRHGRPATTVQNAELKTGHITVQHLRSEDEVAGWLKYIQAPAGGHGRPFAQCVAV